MPVKNFFVVILICFSGLTTANTAIEKPVNVSIEPLSDLQQDAEVSRQEKLPILIFFSASYCHYCEVVKEEFLKPMLRNDEYRKKVLIREAILDSYEKVTDFTGDRVGLDKLALRYRAYLTPTVVILGPEGNEIAERLRGITTVDYYGGYLDDAIDAALLKLQ